MNPNTTTLHGVGKLKIHVFLWAALPLLLMAGCGDNETEPNQARKAFDPKHIKCWAHVSHDGNDPQFKNPFDQIKGPIELSTPRGLKGTRHPDWTGRVDGIVAGPTAKVTVWSEEGFRGTSKTVNPGEKVGDLGAVDLQTVGSIKIEYAP